MRRLTDIVADRATDGYVDEGALQAAAASFHDAQPFPYCVVDGFFAGDIAAALAGEFPDYDSGPWHEYRNPIENKKTCNIWNEFPPLTYRVFDYLNSAAFIAKLERALNIGPLFADPGLNGGGWHMHGRGGKLGVHLDYSLHPKLLLQRRLNIIAFVSPRWEADWGGHLGLWTHDESANGPGRLAARIVPQPNRAVIFDTTRNSWHGLPEPMTCPDGVYRQSLAVYYLTEPPADVDRRGKALFAPSEDQKNDPGLKELIRQRARIESAANVYRK